MHEELGQVPIPDDVRDAAGQWIGVMRQALDRAEQELDNDHLACLINSVLMGTHTSNLMCLFVQQEAPLMFHLVKIGLEEEMRREADDWDRRN